MKTNIDLNKVSGTYSNCLSTHLQKIYDKYNEKCQLSELKELVLEITRSAKPTPNKLKFDQKVSSTKSCNDLIFLVTNSILRANHMSAKVDDRWANER